MKIAKALVAVCWLLFVAGLSPAFAQEKSESDDSATLQFSYKFEQPRFWISIIDIQLDANGEGELRFKRGEEDELIDLKMKVLPATLSRLRQLYEKTNFLNSEENYQDKKDHSNLGTVTLLLSSGNRQRQAKFNYTPNLDIKEIAEIFRGLATQRIHQLDIENAQQYQPLDIPKRLEEVENDLRLERITEPPQLIPVLREISNSNFAPIIARNQAKRIVESIEKQKYKTPIRGEK
ncbi:MAG: hypothetical protein AB1757_04225 [Acidobacteriota bacterium]